MTKRMQSQAAQDSMKAALTRRREKRGDAKARRKQPPWKDARGWWKGNEFAPYVVETPEFPARRDQIFNEFHEEHGYENFNLLRKNSSNEGTPSNRSTP